MNKPTITLTKTNRSNRLNMIETDDKLAQKVGKALIDAFDIAACRVNPLDAGRYSTAWGSKTPAGIARMAVRILTGGTPPPK